MRTLVALLLLIGLCQGSISSYRCTADEIVDVTFADLRVNAATSQASVEVPGAICALRGKQVRIRGFIQALAVERRTGNRDFVLIRDNQAGRPPNVDERIYVRMMDGGSADFTIRPVTITGLLVINESPHADNLIYKLEHARIETTGQKAGSP